MSRQGRPRRVRGSWNYGYPRKNGATLLQESTCLGCPHFIRLCLVNFTCCEKFYPCHKCHNSSPHCIDDQRTATDAKRAKCIVCEYEQVIDEGSQKCRGCDVIMGAYFCGTCKHFCSDTQNIVHCEVCGLCVKSNMSPPDAKECDVCLFKRLSNNKLFEEKKCYTNLDFIETKSHVGDTRVSKTIKCVRK